MEYIEIHPENKNERILKDQFFVKKATLNTEVFCQHCGEDIVLADCKITQRADEPNGMEYVTCANFPKCNGSPIDFFPKYSKYAKAVRKDIKEHKKNLKKIVIM